MTRNAVICVWFREKTPHSPNIFDGLFLLVWAEKPLISRVWCGQEADVKDVLRRLSMILIIIMELTPHGTECVENRAETALKADTAGAPENAEDIPKSDAEITPEILDAMQEAFWRWQGSNSGALYDGGTGDVVALRSALNAAAANRKSSSSEI